VQAELEFADGKPKNWIAGAVIILIWVVVIGLVVFWMVRWIKGLSSG